MATIQFKPIPKLSTGDIQRFWSKVEKRGDAECWPYKGTVLTGGYGQFPVRGSLRCISSRVAYFLSTGVDPGGLMVCHTCDRRVCCNPCHLFLGTHDDNMKDGVAKGRFPRGDKSPVRINIATRPRGEENAAAKLTEANVIMIRQLYADGLASQHELARIFSVKQPTIWQVVHRIKWKHVI